MRGVVLWTRFVGRAERAAMYIHTFFDARTPGAEACRPLSIHKYPVFFSSFFVGLLLHKYSGVVISVFSVFGGAAM